MSISFLHRFRMIKNEIFAKVIQVLVCLAFAFALVFFPPTSAHAEAGVHGGHSALEQSKTTSPQGVHSHLAAHMDCGSNNTDTHTSDTGAYQCCVGMCLAAILIEEFASPQANATAIDVAIPDNLPVAADKHGFLRPPKHLI